MTDGMYSDILDDGIFRYYHPQIKRSGILYVDDDRIDLLEINRVAKTLKCTNSFQVQLEIIRSWVFKARDDLTIN